MVARLWVFVLVWFFRQNVWIDLWLFLWQIRYDIDIWQAGATKLTFLILVAAVQLRWFCKRKLMLDRISIVLEVLITLSKYWHWRAGATRFTCLSAEQLAACVLQDTQYVLPTDRNLQIVWKFLFGKESFSYLDLGKIESIVDFLSNTERTYYRCFYERTDRIISNFSAFHRDLFSVCGHLYTGW